MRHYASYLSKNREKLACVTFSVPWHLLVFVCAKIPHLDLQPWCSSRLCCSSQSLLLLCCPQTPSLLQCWLLVNFGPLIWCNKVCDSFWALFCSFSVLFWWRSWNLAHMLSQGHLGDFVLTKTGMLSWHWCTVHPLPPLGAFFALFLLFFCSFLSRSWALAYMLSQGDLGDSFITNTGVFS